jgi:hypothetical protein
LKIPGRFYYRLGKPIPTKGRQDVLTAAHLYIILYLLERREEDKYRKLFPRLLYKAARGANTEVLAFDPKDSVSANTPLQ